MEHVLVVRGLRRTFRPRTGWLRAVTPRATRAAVTALDGIDLDVAAGERVTLVGPNGAGKTTLFQVTAGLLARDAGEVRVAGRDPETDPSVRALVGWMPADDRSLVTRLTCRENLDLHARLHGLPRATTGAAIDRALADVALEDRADDLAGSLSAGMRARLQVARAVLHDPPLLLLDEPTASLDPVASARVLGVVRRLVDDRGVAAVIASHRLDEVERLGGRVVVLDRGRVQHDGDVAEVGADGLARLLRVDDAEVAP